MIAIYFKPELVEKVVKGIMDNFPEASATLQCTSWKYDKFLFTFQDSDDGKIYKVTKRTLFKAFDLMVHGDNWPKGCTAPPANDTWDSWDEWLGQADATDFDAFAQLACFGKVIYG